MKSLHDDKYLIRNSLFNLVELSLLARMYEEHCTPSSGGGKINQESLTQTMLKMKATEHNGSLRVAIYDAEPVGFFWDFNGQSAQWVHPEHRLEGIEQTLAHPV